MKTCKYKFIDNNGDEYYCNHPSFGYSDYCIFHYKDINKKRRKFYKLFDDLVNNLEKDSKIDLLDFKGFIFPKFDFNKRVFNKPVDFRHSIFWGKVFFNGCIFKHDVNFLGAQFNNKAIFQGTIFGAKSVFMGVKFFSRAIFVGGAFNNRVVFHGCKFRDVAVFKGRHFNKEALFQGNTFFKDADFGESKFDEFVDLSGSCFKQSLNFKDARFLNEINAENVKISKFKNFNLPVTTFDGAVLESANFYQMPVLNGFSFRNSFLISCNFSGKKVINCDFTGAVLKAIHTKDWILDEQTIKNTKYIYTNYKISTVKKDNEEINVYEKDENSRVPAKGTFGDESNPDFTLKSYLKEPYKWDYLLEFPSEIRTGLLNYLNFFRDYVIATENIDVNISTQPEGKKIRLIFLVENEEKLTQVKSILSDYIINIFKPFNRLSVEFRNTTISEFEKERFLINYQNELLTTQTRLKYGLSNVKGIEQTTKCLAPFINEHKYQEREILDILKLAVSGLVKSSETLAKKQPISKSISISESSSKSSSLVNLNFEINISLAKLKDYLNEIDTNDISIQNQLKILKEEIEDIHQEFQNESSSHKLKSRLKPVLEHIKDLTKFGIKNSDKIILLLNYINSLSS